MRKKLQVLCMILALVLGVGAGVVATRYVGKAKGGAASLLTDSNSGAAEGTAETASGGEARNQADAASGSGENAGSGAEAAAEPTAVPTETPAPEPTETPAPEPTETPAPEPTETPVPEPTETPAPEPTETPAPEPTETPAPEPTETPAPEPTETPAPEPVPYTDLYARFLEDHYLNADGSPCFQLIYLDDDDIPELAVTDGYYHFSCVYIFTIRDGEVVNISREGNGFGEYGDMFYSERDNIIFSSYSSYTFGDYVYMTYDGYDISPLAYFRRQASESGGGDEYFVDGLKVTEDEYNKARSRLPAVEEMQTAGFGTSSPVNAEFIARLREDDDVCYNGEGGLY